MSAPPIIDRLELLYAEQLEDREILRQIPKKPDHDRTGNATSSEIRDQHFLAIAEFILHQDVAAFRRHMSQAALNKLQLFERYDAGEPIDGSYVTMNAQDELFDALAAGDFNVASKLARRIGGRPDLEKRHDLPTRSLLGYALKYTVLEQRDGIHEVLAPLEAICQEKKHLPFRGFPTCFRGLVESNLTMTNQGLQEIADGHRRLAKKPNWFAGTVEELISVWGIGMANLARHQGMAVNSCPPFIPAELLIEVNPN
jgi:hypothetical protein